MNVTTGILVDLSSAQLKLVHSPRVNKFHIFVTFTSCAIFYSVACADAHLINFINDWVTGPGELRWKSYQSWVIDTMNCCTIKISIIVRTNLKQSKSSTSTLRQDSLQRKTAEPSNVELHDLPQRWKLWQTCLNWFVSLFTTFLPQPVSSIPPVCVMKLCASLPL